MKLTEAIQQIEKGFTVSASPQTWSDLGSGTGLFTHALATLLCPGSTIYAVDKNARLLESIRPVDGIRIEKMVADFYMDELPFHSLDGIILANALHFIEDKIILISKLQQWLSAQGRIILIEYDMDTANTWVPYPLSFQAATNLFNMAGFSIEKTGSWPSVYHRSGMYIALIRKLP